MFDFAALSDGSVSEPLKLFFAFALLGVFPIFLVTMTAFTRIVIVLSMLRQALGLQNTPPNIVIICISLMLTVLSMKPLIVHFDEQIYPAVTAGEMSDLEAATEMKSMLMEQMSSRIRADDLAFVMEITEAKESEASSIFTLVPAYMLSELRIAFEIGFLILIPFLLIDIVVASVLMSVGMIMLPIVLPTPVVKSRSWAPAAVKPVSDSGA